MIEQAQLALEGLADAKIVRLEGREAMNELSEFVLDVLSADPDIDPGSLIDRNAVVAVGDAAGEVTHYHLVVLQAAHRGHFRGHDRYQITLGPPAARLALRVNHEIYQDKTTQEIVASLLDRVGIPSSLVVWRLGAQYAKRAYTVQYAESDWAFLARLLADEGINTWFDRVGDETNIVFGDGSSSHEGIEGDSPTVPFQDGSGMAGTAFAFHGLQRTWSIVSTRATLRDVDVQRPAVPVDGEAGKGALEIFEYPSNLVIPEAAAARAKVRLSQLTRNRSTLTAETANTRIRAGRVVDIVGAADECFSGKFLVTAVEHELAQASQEDSRGVPYRNRITLVPFAPDVPYRPAVPENESLPGQKVRSSWGSLSTPGGGKLNQLRFDDAAGAEGMHTNASRNFNERTENDKVTTVTADETNTVGGNHVNTVTLQQIVGVTGAQTYSIGGNRDLTTVGVLGISAASESVTVGGVRKFTVGGDYASKAASLARIVGAAEDVVAIQETNRHVTGASSIAVGSTWAEIGGISASIGVMGASTLTVAGPLSVSASNVSINPSILSETYAGLYRGHAGAKLTIKAPTIKMQAGGACKVKGADVFFKATSKIVVKAGGVTITILPGSIKVKGKLKGDSTSVVTTKEEVG